VKLHPEKCHLFRREVTFLGHVLGGQWIGLMEEKVKAVSNWHTPTTSQQLKSFLGLPSYYRRFVRGFYSIADPLFPLLKKDNSFTWTEECQNSFAALKQALVTAHVLFPPDLALPFILDTAPAMWV